MKTSYENYCSCGKENGVSMPICFLVKEQAKSLVAIQDLQKRVEFVESVQDDVVDSVAEFWKCLCDNSRSGNLSDTSDSVQGLKGLNLSTKSRLFPKSGARRCSHSSLKPIFDDSSLPPKLRSYSLKELDNVTSLCKKRGISVQEQSQKFFDLVKSKDSALESDKQDSGLDSDCRDHNDGHVSLHKDINNWEESDSNDELLILLDEISHRSEILQQQLAAAEENCILESVKQEMSASQIENGVHPSLQRVPGVNDTFTAKQGHFRSINCDPPYVKDSQQKYYSTIIEGQEHVATEDVPKTKKLTCSGALGESFEKKSVFDKTPKKKRLASNNIDSAMVSSVLKETNVVDLQRQVLIYLVENAVLQTKLVEVEQILACKLSEKDKIENSLKDETRLLMMENRELRISLDEQKLEVNVLKSKLSMLERVLQSVTVENRELNWQLGESLGLPNLPRRDINFSPGFTYGNSASSKCLRKSSLLSQDRNSAYNKSKSQSNTNSFLGSTLEETEEYPLSRNRSVSSVARKPLSEPLQSSTPVMPSPKPKDLKSKSVLSSQDIPVPTNFQSVKKRLKANCNIERENVSRNLQPEKSQEVFVSNTCDKDVTYPTETGEAVLPIGNAKFPFSTILERLKSNSDYRLSKRPTSAQNPEESSNSCTDQTKPYFNSKVRNLTPQVVENSFCSDRKSQGSNQNISQENCENNTNFQSRKGRNIHQRIQDILDRIMAESEEAS
ncbi:uncharacterized protein LOC118180867 [Stegodyphus dumicola]|uniref:uncharacterized protein LOC118180867 n=1 Tax=Stegodyphus dumicola TaxID=202533 RepID=UPI0015A7D14E|nr:uncharacterized protein LOC118180867 [Stegodyphus dumicola]